MIHKISGSGDKIKAVVAPGSTQRYYTENHQLIRTLKNHCEVIYSLDLPGHGPEASKSIKNMSANDALKLFATIIKQIEANELLLVGYSLGAMFLLKNWSFLRSKIKDLYGVFIGVGFRLSEKNLPKVKMFFTPEFFESLRWTKFMEKNHGPFWKDVVLQTQQWLMPESGLYLSDAEIKQLEEDKNNITFILGKQDQPFDLEDLMIDNQLLFDVKQVNSDHFNYFVNNKGYNEVKEIIENIIKKIKEN